MKTKFWLWFLVMGIFAIFLGCGNGDDDDRRDFHDDGGDDQSNDQNENQNRDRHLIKFVPGKNGEPNEIHILYATDKDGVIINLVKNSQVAEFDPDCDRKVQALIESHCTGYPEVKGGGPGLRIPYKDYVIFKINRPGDIMIPGLIIDDHEIYSLNTDFVDVEGPSGSIFVSEGLIYWGSGAVCSNFVCEEGTDSDLPDWKSWD